MRINNNIMAMNTHRQYAINNDNVASSTEKLSSGYRINRAGDDAAGLAISEKMRAQIRGLDMASKNSEDAISLVQTAEGALTETHSILQRMNELAVQSASDTNESIDRNALQAEFTALASEIDDIAGKTTFNNKKLLDGTFGTTTNIDTAGDITEFNNGVKSISFEGFAAGTYSVTYDGTSHDWTLNDGTSDIGTFNYEDADGDGSFTLSFGANGSLGSVEIELDATHTAFADTNELDFTVTNTGAKIQTGANANETLDISIDSMKASTLGVSTLDISVRDGATGATAAITAVQTAINTVSTQRSKLGAIQNRLDHKINNLDTSSENLSAAESRIRDVDMAEQMTEFTTQNILVQAATAMLAQANSAPQNVLSLLK